MLGCCVRIYQMARRLQHLWRSSTLKEAAEARAETAETRAEEEALRRQQAEAELEKLRGTTCYISTLIKNMEFRDQTIILGVTGGIAIHKSLDVASQLVKDGASVHVVMTENATRLVQPLQFQVISRNPVLLNLFDVGTDWKPPHIDLADRADLLAIVPATANIIGKLANGIADDGLSTVAVSVHCPILLTPAMNGHMYQNPFVQRNIDLLKTHGVHLSNPRAVI